VVWHQQGYLGKLPSFVNIPGRVAVWLFFGISGYVIFYGFLTNRYRLNNTNDLVNYCRNRLLRILPLFLFFTCLCWVTELYQTNKNPLSLKEILPQVFCMQWNQDYKLLGVFWTLGIEIQFYLIAPVMAAPLLLGRHKQRVFVTLILYALCVLLVIQIAQRPGFSMDTRNLLFALPHFLVGMIGCLVFNNKTVSSVLGYLFLAVFLLLLGLVSYVYHVLPEKFWSWRGILLVDLAILLLVGFHQSFQTKKILSRFNTSLYLAFAWIGVLSYGIYAWHAFFLKYIPDLGQWILYLIFVSVIASLGSYFLIEKAALRFRWEHSPSFNPTKRAGPRLK